MVGDKGLKLQLNNCMAENTTFTVAIHIDKC